MTDDKPSKIAYLAHERQERGRDFERELQDIMRNCRNIGADPEYARTIADSIQFFDLLVFEAALILETNELGGDAKAAVDLAKAIAAHIADRIWQESEGK